MTGASHNETKILSETGHGGQTPDLDGDEEDGYDEVIYPVDFRQAGHIVDDEMHRIMVRPLRPGVRLTAIFDSCHSGSALDLPYIYSTQGILKEPNLYGHSEELHEQASSKRHMAVGSNKLVKKYIHFKDRSKIDQAPDRYWMTRSRRRSKIK